MIEKLYVGYFIDSDQGYCLILLNQLNIKLNNIQLNTKERYYFR